MKAEDKIAVLLKPQTFAGSTINGYTTDALSQQTGLTLQTIRRALLKLKEVGKADVYKSSASYDCKNYWFTELWQAPPAAPAQAVLPPPDFSPPAQKAVEEVQAEPSRPTAWVRRITPPSLTRHLRSPHNQAVTRCGMVIRAAVWAECPPPKQAEYSACAACQKASQTQQVHTHRWVGNPFSPIEKCAVKGCKATRQKALK